MVPPLSDGFDLVTQTVPSLSGVIRSMLFDRIFHRLTLLIDPASNPVLQVGAESLQRRFEPDYFSMI